MRIVSLLARHGVDKYTAALTDLRALFRETLPSVDHSIVVADNALPPEFDESGDDGVRIIGAGNDAWEFSAWDSAVSRLGGDLDDFDFVHLATSAFFQLYTRYLHRFSIEMLESMRGRGVAIGHIDYYGTPVSLQGFGGQSWLRSSYVFLPPAELRLLGSLVSVRDEALFFSEDPQQPFLDAAPVSLNYRKFILDWLTGPGTGQGTEWHSRFELSARTLPYFKNKAMAIFNEQMLSRRLRAQGCETVDATWLAGAVKDGSFEFGGALPMPHIQVHRRDVDAAPVNFGLSD